MQQENALNAAWSAAWSDFLCNRVTVAERRAAGWLHLLEPTIEAGTDAERLVTLADMAHMAGAALADDTMLRRAADAYDAHLKLEPANVAAIRMKAETLLRLREYEAAFSCFHHVHTLSCQDASVEVAPFRLLHDAECIEDAVRLGADPAHLRTSEAWRELASHLQAAAPTGTEPKLSRTAVSALGPIERALLGPDYGKPLPCPPTSADGAVDAAEGESSPQLRSSIDWEAVQAAYQRDRVVVIDDFFDAPALAALQAYAAHGAHFGSMRRGYLGCFPTDGLTHASLARLVRELASAAPALFGAHALALWWLFKYDESNGEGIGIHADPAAVNLNVWLTDDRACLDGGGLAVYSHVPPLEQATSAVNREFAHGEESDLRAALEAHGTVTRIPYKCNRATLFVSDQYHESVPFRFAPAYAQRRVNLTLLFGDRWTPQAHSHGHGQRDAGAAREPRRGGSASTVAPEADATTAAEDPFGVFD